MPNPGKTFGAGVLILIGSLARPIERVDSGRASDGTITVKFVVDWPIGLFLIRVGIRAIASEQIRAFPIAPWLINNDGLYFRFCKLRSGQGRGADQRGHSCCRE